MMPAPSLRIETAGEASGLPGGTPAVLLDLHGDRRPLCGRRLRQRHHQHAVLEGRGDLASVHRHRQPDAAEERAIGPLDTVITLLLLLGPLLLFSLQGEQVARQLDADLLGIDAGQLRRHDHGVLRLRHIEHRCPCAGCHGRERFQDRFGEAVEEALHLPLQLTTPRSQSPHCLLLSRATSSGPDEQGEVHTRCQTTTTSIRDLVKWSGQWMVRRRPSAGAAPHHPLPSKLEPSHVHVVLRVIRAEACPLQSHPTWNATGNRMDRRHHRAGLGEREIHTRGPWSGNEPHGSLVGPRAARRQGRSMQRDAQVALVDDRLDQTLAQAADGAVAIGADGRIVLWNNAATRITGYPPGEAIGRLCCDLLAGYDADGNRICHRGCSETLVTMGGPVRTVDMLTRTKTGQPIWLEVSILVLPEIAERAALTVHLFRDITASKELLARVQEHLGPPADPGEHSPGVLTRRELDLLGLMT